MVIIALVMMFLMKNKEKRKEIVRRMSRVYANNNPILFVIDGENGDDDDDDLSSSDDVPNHVQHQEIQLIEYVTHQDSSVIAESAAACATKPIEEQVTDQKKQQLQSSPKPMKGILRTQLSLSLPHGIDQIHLKNNGNI